ncbi:IS630 family transposase [Legionella anisa]|uniref:IS630 family transposase n=1 Tax=Legionella anisa TaxID=28082 RepID=UPI000D7066A8|nr:IS630 family transposase [Legionella anisa]AWN75245.1 IS630 family transposase [Legionella anisa]HAT9162572.1 IS630 family transposase [Legionella pneumophila subsp. pneumophila]
MIRISLSEEERTDLIRLRRSQKSNIGERAYYVLLCGEGKSVSETAKIAGRNEHTIRLWLKRYITYGVIGLKSRSQPGRPARKAPIIESQLEELLGSSPQDYGYQEAGWQINLLRDWFEKQGVSVCDNTLVKSLNRLGFVYKRFSKTLPANAPSTTEKKARIREIVEEIRKDSAPDIEILFADESHFSNQPYVSRGWFKGGEKK